MEIDVKEEDLKKWFADKEKGTAPLIQKAFPYLSTDEREFILTGITPDEWDEIFK